MLICLKRTILGSKKLINECWSYVKIITTSLFLQCYVEIDHYTKPHYGVMDDAWSKVDKCSLSITDKTLHIQ